MFKRSSLRTSLALALGLFTTAVQAETITAYTGTLPPYTMENGGAPQGIAHELVTEMGKRAGIDITIEYMPWKRAQSTVQQTPNSLLLPTSRTTPREDIYAWVSQLLVADEVFATKSSSIDSLDQARGLKSIAIMGGTPRDKRLHAEGFENLTVTKDTITAIRLLDAGRTDAWFTLNHRFFYTLKQEGLDPNSVTVGTPIKSQHLWLAAHKDFDADTAAALAKAMEELQADGTYDAILAKYLN